MRTQVGFKVPAHRLTMPQIIMILTQSHYTDTWPTSPALTLNGER